MNLYNLFFPVYYTPGYLQYNWSGKGVWMRLATGLAEDNSLGKPLAFSHVFDLRAFAPLHLNHKRNAFVNFQDQLTITAFLSRQFILEIGTENYSR